MPVKVLVVDDSALMRRAIKEMLVGAGCTVETARNGLDALEHVRRDPPDVVTLDINMPEMDGLTCLARLMAERPVPVIMVSSLTADNARPTLEALDLGAVDYVEKPGGTVSLDIGSVQDDLVAKVRAAATARVRRAVALRASRTSGTPVPAPRDAPPVRAARPPRTASGRPPRGPVPTARPGGRPDPELVVVGSSTGGPSALGVVLSALPASFPAPVVVAQHIPASFTRHLAERLDESCALTVVEVAGIEPLQPGVAYIGQGDADVVIARRGTTLVAKSVPASPEHRWHPSVDRLATTAASLVNPERIIGVLLTGMGDDGAASLAAIRAAGGLTIAESEETAVVWGMPGELARRDGATRVLPIQGIGPQVAMWGSGVGVVRR